MSEDHIGDRYVSLPRPAFPSTRINQRDGFKSKKSVIHRQKDTNPYIVKGYRQPKLKFREPGYYIAAAESERKRAKLEALSKSINSKLQEAISTDKTGMDSFLFVAIFDSTTCYLRSLAQDPAPVAEWWDSPFIGGNDDDSDRDEALITSNVYHFPPIEPGAPQPISRIHPVILTKKESRKQRRLLRLEAQKEKREQIRLGLLPPEETKLKMSNYTKVLGQMALQEPTRAEAMVRKQIKERRAKHEEANMERALSEDERRAKKIKYWKELGAGTLSAGSLLVQAIAFSVPFIGPKERFKLVANGGQLHLTGAIIKLPKMGLIFAEGSLRGITRYKKLVLSRIKWIPEDEQFPQEDKQNLFEDESKARLIWQGTSVKPKCTKFQWMEFENESEAHLYLKGLDLDHLLKILPDDVLLASI